MKIVTPDAILAESIRGRAGLPPRRFVILPSDEGLAVYDATSSRRVSRFVKSKAAALEDLAALQVGAYAYPV